MESISDIQNTNKVYVINLYCAYMHVSNYIRKQHDPSSLVLLA
jgi:hypothetical protein